MRSPTSRGGEGKGEEWRRGVRVGRGGDRRRAFRGGSSCRQTRRPPPIRGDVMVTWSSQKIGFASLGFAMHDLDCNIVTVPGLHALHYANL